MAAGCAKAAACGAGTVTAGDGPVDRASRRGRATTAMDLRKLILALALLGAFLPFAKTLHASYQVQRQQLIDSTLESNLAYATKLAKSTDDFVQSAQLQLDYTAQLLAGQMDDAAKLEKEAARLRLTSKSFNSIVIFDDAGTVLATSPEALQLQGKTLASAAVRESIRSRQPLISRPYLSAAGNFIVLVVSPIRDPRGGFLGAIGGAIYLQKENILDRLLGQHFYRDGSYLYVVDGERRIIYHPDPDRIGKVVTGNAAVDEVTRGGSGTATLVNSKGTTMLAGYAPVAATGWGVIAQRPRDVTLAPLASLMRTVFVKTLPLAVATMLLLWWCARIIAHPLRMLADGARDMDQPGTPQRIRSVRSWYFESRELKKAMLLGIGLFQKSISKLREDVNTDPLTGLGNRRHLQARVQELQERGTPFAVVSLDIDHFKRVNDTWGHDVGDLVLKQLSMHMQDISRVDDTPCRVGGEEFVLLLPGASVASAAQVAERLRLQIERANMAPVDRVTVSLGVAAWPESSADVGTVFKNADDMLYAAKRGGRNRVEVYVPGN
ncbi:MAG: GGDEF domain-containing protein [Stenotrophomonas sp.]|nr:GGDEF domain-containing protein [Stenotrophomonas sp.]